VTDLTSGNDVLVITGFDELLSALETSPQDAIPYLHAGMVESVSVVQADLQDYPPATERNAPGRFDIHGKPMGYYERGRGYWYPILRRGTLEEAATIAGGYGKRRMVIKATRKQKALAPEVVGYKNTGKSEQLGKSWNSRVDDASDGVTGLVGTNTSYAGEVEGDEQTSLMETIGWPRMDKVLEEDGDQIFDAFTQATERYLENFDPQGKEQ